LDVDYHPESYTAEPVREWRDLDFGHAPNGVPYERTADKLQKLVRTTRLLGMRHAD
jgi:hypothetical protein